MPIISCFPGGTHDGGLALDISAYASADAMPDTAAEYAIALITSVKMGTVTIDSDAPAAATTGDIWVQLDDASVNVIQIGDGGHSIVLALGLAHQYTGTSWQEIVGYVYIDGWVVLDMGIPDGSTAIPPNDVTTWLKCAAVRPSSVGNPTLAQVCSNESLMSILANSQNALDYMVRSTGIQAAVLASATAQNALNASVPWTNPIMTSNTQPSGKVTCSSAFYSISDVYKAFNNVLPDNYWSSATTDAQEWVMYEFDAYIWIYKYQLYVSTASSHADTYTCTYVVQVSANGSDWTTICDPHTTENTYYSPAKFEGYADPSVDYARYVRVLKSAGTGWAGVHDLRLWGKAAAV